MSMLRGVVVVLLRSGTRLNIVGIISAVALIGLWVWAAMTMEDVPRADYWTGLAAVTPAIVMLGLLLTGRVWGMRGYPVLPRPRGLDLTGKPMSLDWIEHKADGIVWFLNWFAPLALGGALSFVAFGALRT